MNIIMSNLRTVGASGFWIFSQFADRPAHNGVPRRGGRRPLHSDQASALRTVSGRESVRTLCADHHIQANGAGLKQDH
jgi:hypothetical protein